MMSSDNPNLYFMHNVNFEFEVLGLSVGLADPKIPLGNTPSSSLFLFKF